MSILPATMDWKFGQMALVDQAQASALPLKHTDVLAQVSGPLAEVKVMQHFHNPFDHPVELVYHFPLPEDGAVFDFIFHLGSETIRADVQTNEKARQIYDEALQQGIHSVLLEQRRPNLFVVQLANVQPGEEISAEIHFQHVLNFNDDCYEWIFPMGITPKYHKNAREAEQLDSPMALPGESIGTVAIHAEIDAGQDISEPTSPSHDIMARLLNRKRWQVEIAAGTIPNKDFVLRYRVAEGKISTPIFFSGNENNAIALLTLVPFRPQSEAEPAPREFVFVLDRSGSMDGAPILQARNALRACLRTLGSMDSFYLVAFNDRVEVFDPAVSVFNQNNLQRADQWLAAIMASGGTEIQQAVETAMNFPAEAERSRVILLFTDGAVSAEKQIMDKIRRQLGQSRFFTFGIGPSVNRALLNRIAALGRGTAEFLQLDEDIESAIIRFQDRLAYPLLQDIRLEWEGTSAWDVIPDTLPDLYDGLPLQVVARFKPAAIAAVKVIGRCGKEIFEYRIPLSGAKRHNELVERTFARRRIDFLLEQQDIQPEKIDHWREQIVSLALEHRLVTPYTSLVAVKQEESRTKIGDQVRVALPLPEGLSSRGFMESPPSVYLSVMPSFAMKSSPRRFFGAFSSGAPKKMDREFLRPATGQDLDSDIDRGMIIRALSGKDQSEPLSDKHLLSRLAGLQNACGSWGEGEQQVELTAAALLAFVRRGHTLSRGGYRRIVIKAVKWLLANFATDDVSRQARALALIELQQVCTDALLAGVGTAEQEAVKGIAIPAMKTARTLEHVRDAAMSRIKVRVEYQPSIGEAGWIWLAALDQ